VSSGSRWLDIDASAADVGVAEDGTAVEGSSRSASSVGDLSPVASTEMRLLLESSAGHDMELEHDPSDACSEGAASAPRPTVPVPDDLCVSMCCFMFPLVEKDRWHSRHWNGRSFV